MHDLGFDGVEDSDNWELVLRLVEEVEILTERCRVLQKENTLLRDNNRAFAVQERELTAQIHHLENASRTSHN
jgi:hypothetical protein